MRFFTGIMLTYSTVLGHVHWQEFFIPHTPFLYKTWYNRHTFMLFLLSKRFVVRTSKVLYPQFLYEIPFYVRGKKRTNIRKETMKRQSLTVEVAGSRH